MRIFRIGPTGFGGVGPIARGVIVERRRWMEAGEHARLVGGCRGLPGANAVDVVVMMAASTVCYRAARMRAVAVRLAQAIEA